MADTEPSESFDAEGPSRRDRLNDMGTTVRNRTILIIVAVVGLMLAWLIGSAVIPRWWAQRIGDLIDGRLIFGSFFGFGVGAVFTILPLLTLWIAWRYRRNWKRALVIIVIAVVLAAPNLATLGVVIGSGNAAHAGERILDVDGPGFRGGSLVGSLIGALLTFAVISLAASRGRNKRKAAALKAEQEAASNDKRRKSDEPVER